MFNKCRKCKEIYHSDTFASRYCHKCKKPERIKKVKEFKNKCLGCKTIYESNKSLYPYYCDKCKPKMQEIIEKEKALAESIRKKEKDLAEAIRKQEQCLNFENKCLFCKRLFRTNNINSNYCDQCKAKTVFRKCEFCNQKFRTFHFGQPVCDSCMIKSKKMGNIILEAIENNKLKKLSTSIQS